MKNTAHICVVEGIPPHLTVAVERAAAVQVDVGPRQEPKRRSVGASAYVQAAAYSGH